MLSREEALKLSVTAVLPPSTAKLGVEFGKDLCNFGVSTRNWSPLATSTTCGEKWALTCTENNSAALLWALTANQDGMCPGGVCVL